MEKGMAKVPGVCSEVGQPVPVCQPREKSLQRERLKYPERREVLEVLGEGQPWRGDPLRSQGGTLIPVTECVLARSPVCM